MKKFAILIFLLFSLTAAHCQTKKNLFYNLNGQQNFQATAKISAHDIKKEIKAIDDTATHLLKITKELPMIFEGTPMLLLIETRHQDFQKNINKLTIMYTFYDVTVFEQYYFKNNTLIAYKIHEYRSKILLHSEAGYLIDYKSLDAYVNGKRCKLDKESEQMILNSTKDNIFQYFKMLYNN